VPTAADFAARRRRFEAAWHEFGGSKSDAELGELLGMTRSQVRGDREVLGLERPPPPRDVERERRRAAARLGLARRRSRQEQEQAEAITARTDPLVVSCARCGWSLAGPTNEVLAEQIEHRESCSGLVAERRFIPGRGWQTRLVAAEVAA
jgi:hypothetical protein